MACHMYPTRTAHRHVHQFRKFGSYESVERLKFNQEENTGNWSPCPESVKNCAEDALSTIDFHFGIAYYSVLIVRLELESLELQVQEGLGNFCMTYMIKGSLHVNVLDTTSRTSEDECKW
jgi:hypothetical protein